MDFLGLTNLTILGRAVELIRWAARRAARPDGAARWRSRDGGASPRGQDVRGVPAGESAGMRRYVQELQPQGIREVAAMVALYRPGPSTSRATSM
ncbi:MAG: hypothetical protein U0360_11210 [Dehalococcoidia bacterium]